MPDMNSSDFDQVFNHVCVLSSMRNTLAKKYFIYTVQQGTMHNKNWIYLAHTDL